MKPVILLAFTLCCSAADYPRTIPSGSAIYIEPQNGLEKSLIAAFQTRHVPLRIVSSPEEADYTLGARSVSSSQEVDIPWNGGTRPEYFPTVYEPVWLTSKSGDVVWKYVVSKRILKRGAQPVAETIANHIKGVIVKNPKP